MAAAPPVVALALDPLTVADDSQFLSTLQNFEKNLPPGFAKAVATLYSASLAGSQPTPDKTRVFARHNLIRSMVAGDYRLGEKLSNCCVWEVGAFLVDNSLSGLLR